MSQLQKELPKEQHLTINKELQAWDTIITHEDLHKVITTAIQQGKTYIFVDEIQYISNREKAINSLFAQYQDTVDFIISWSNSQMISSELSTLLAGRYIQIEVLPFGYQEFCELFSHKIGKESFMLFIQKGGLPSVYSLQDEQLISEWIQQLKNTVFLKDIVGRYNIKDVYLLEDLFLFLVHNMGKQTSLTSILKALKTKGITTNLTTLHSYIDMLQDSYLVYEAPIYTIQGKQLLDRQRKYYISDHAFRNHLFSNYEPWIATILENIVFIEAKRQHYEVHVGRNKDKEIDFVLQKWGKSIYIQVAYLLSSEETIAREFGNLKQIPDNRSKYVVSMDEINFGEIHWIKHLPIRELSSILS